MAEKDKTDTEEENFYLHCIQDDQKMEGNVWDVPGTPAECSNGSAMSGGEHTFVNYRNQILIFFHEKTFIFDPIFNKHNNQVATYGNNVSVHYRVSTTKHSAAVTMLNWRRNIKLGEDSSGLV